VEKKFERRDSSVVDDEVGEEKICWKKLEISLVWESWEVLPPTVLLLACPTPAPRNIFKNELISPPEPSPRRLPGLPIFIEFELLFC